MTDWAVVGWSRRKWPGATVSFRQEDVGRYSAALRLGNAAEEGNGWNGARRMPGDGGCLWNVVETGRGRGELGL